MKVLYKITTVLAYVFTFIVYWIGSLGVHIYTVYNVFQSYGTLWGIISIFTPVLAQIVMFILYIIAYGILNPFCITIIIYLGCMIITTLITWLASYIETKIKD